MVSSSGTPGLGQCSSRRSTKGEPQALQALLDRAPEVSGPEAIGPDLGGQEDSSRGTPLARMPAPTSRSLPYIWAVSMCR